MSKIGFLFAFYVALTTCFLPVRAEKLRLGDIPDKPSKEDRAKNAEADQEAYTPEEKKQLVTELSEGYYQKGLVALRQGRLQEAKDYFEKVLALSPNNTRAQTHLTALNKKLQATKKTAKRTPVPVPPVVEEKPKPAKKPPAPRTIAPEEAPKKTAIDKEGSDDLYLQALTAVQNKEKGKAFELCKESLKLNPNNLQAQRMFDRLNK